jgi:hypothetical protein
MSTRWTPNVPPSEQPDPAEPAWKKYVLPGAGAAALLLVVIIVVAIFALGNDNESNAADDDDQDEIELALEESASATQTAEAPSDDEDDASPTPTPAPTPEPTSEMTTPTPEPEVAEEVELEPTPTPTPIPVAEEPIPTATPEPNQPAPEAPPVTGDFGELPPGDMPSGSPADALSLSFNLDMSLQAIPRQAAAYQINRRQWSVNDAQAMASRLGIDANVVDQGGGSFRAEGSSASIYITPATIQYVRQSSGGSTPSLPGNDQLVQTARTWLVDNGLTGADVGSGRVLDRDESTGRAFVLLKPVEPSEIISATPSAGVTVRGDGVVVEASINWPASLSASTYGLRSAENLWADATQGRGFIDIRAADLPANFQGAAGTVNITNGSIAYTIAGSPQGTQFLVPVAVFSGTANVQGTSVPVRIYVQAAAAQAGPRG